MNAGLNIFYQEILKQVLKNLKSFYESGKIEWFDQCAEKLYNSYCCLEDEYSKFIYKQVIIKRIVNYYKFEGLDNSKELPSLDVKTSIIKNSENKIQFYRGHKLKLINASIFDKEFKVECINELEFLKRKQYLYDRDGLKIYPQEEDYVIDGGAFIGDTALCFSSLVGKNGKVFSFEVLKENVSILEENINRHHLKNIEIFKCGLSNEIKDFPLLSNSTNTAQGSFNITNNSMAPLQTIDNLVFLEKIKKIDFIKLDIEGFELNALRGSINSILNFKPKMAICLYHWRSHLYEIILFIKNNFPFYKLRINHHDESMAETVLYCY